MKIATLVARMLLGAQFAAAGLGGFIFAFNAPPTPPGLAGTFQSVFLQSHWVLFVAAVQLGAGVLLLLNRYVPWRSLPLRRSSRTFSSFTSRWRRSAFSLAQSQPCFGSSSPYRYARISAAARCADPVSLAN
jgi:hypothetical protein